MKNIDFAESEGTSSSPVRSWCRDSPRVARASLTKMECQIWQVSACQEDYQNVFRLLKRKMNPSSSPGLRFLHQLKVRFGRFKVVKKLHIVKEIVKRGNPPPSPGLRFLHQAALNLLPLLLESLPVILQHLLLLSKSLLLLAALRLCQKL